MQADKITSMITAAGVEVEPIWAALLAKALEGKNVKDLLSNVGGGGAPAAGGGAPAAASGGGAAAPVEEVKEEKKEEKEESDDDMVSTHLLAFYRYSDCVAPISRASDCSIKPPCFDHRYSISVFYFSFKTNHSSVRVCITVAPRPT